MNYESILKQLKEEGNPVPSQRFRISIPNAREELKNAMTAILGSMGEKLIWLPEYDKVADWLSDNNESLRRQPTTIRHPQPRPPARFENSRFCGLFFAGWYNYTKTQRKSREYENQNE